MIEHLVAGLAGGGRGVEILHVDARLSDGTEDIGRPRLGKVLSIFRFAAAAWRLRARRGAAVFYYVPSPPKRASLYRDWIVMALCRPWFPRLVLHWHAVGLGAWLDSGARPWERRVTRLLLGRADASLVLSELNAGDAQKLEPRRIIVVPNGIPDPCPDYAARLAPERRRRGEALRASAEPGGPRRDAEVLFLALCSRDKGVLDAVLAVKEANGLLESRRAGLRFRLKVAGTFVDEDVRREFDRLSREAGCVDCAGFLDAAGKAAAFAAADVFLFPTYYANEGQPLNLAEAMAWGVPPVTTRWRAIPEMPPAGWPGLVEPRDVAACAAALVRVAAGAADLAPAVRARFEAAFRLDRHLDVLAAALRDAAGDGPGRRGADGRRPGG